MQKSKSLSSLPPVPGGSAPRVLPLNNTLSLIVSDVPAEMYGTEAIESRLHDIDWVARCGSAHHAVCDEVAQTHTVVPFRLFTLFSDEAKAKSTLARRARRIETALKRVAGKGEWVLRIGKPDPGAAGAVGATGADSAASSGTSFLQKKSAARQAAAATAERVRDDAAKVFATLSEIAAESTHRPADQAAGLLLDAAFLVPARQVPAFKRALSKAAAGLLRDGCRVSLTGPWPPYSFVSLAEARRG